MEQKSLKKKKKIQRTNVRSLYKLDFGNQRRKAEEQAAV